MDTELEQIREQNRYKPNDTNQQYTPPTNIPPNTATWMLATAGFIDGLQALITLTGVGAIINPFVSIFAAILFWFWFKIYNVSLLTWQRMLTFMFGGVLEAIPVVDALPGWYGIVWRIIQTTKTSS